MSPVVKQCDRKSVQLWWLSSVLCPSAFSSRSSSRAHLERTVCSLRMTHPQQNELYAAGSLANKHSLICTVWWSSSLTYSLNLQTANTKLRQPVSRRRPLWTACDVSLKARMRAVSLTYMTKWKIISGYRDFLVSCTSHIYRNGRFVIIAPIAMETGLKSQTYCYYTVHECVLINPLPQLPGNAAQPCGFVTPPPLGLVKGTFRHSNDFSLPGSRAHLLPPDSFQMLPGRSFCLLVLNECFFALCVLYTLSHIGHFVAQQLICVTDAFSPLHFCHLQYLTQWTRFLARLYDFFFFFWLGLQIIKSIMSNILHAYGLAEIFVVWSIRRHTHMQPLYADFVTLHALIIG